MAFQMPHYFILFEDNNVEIHPLVVNLDVFPMGTWALSGSNEETEVPCPAFLSAAERQIAWIVLTTSPSAKRWKKWKKCHNMIMFVMKHFTFEEMTALRFVRLDFYKYFLFAEHFHAARYLVSMPAIFNTITESGGLLHTLV